MCFGPSTLGGARTRLESRIKKVYATLCLQAAAGFEPSVINWRALEYVDQLYKSTTTIVSRYTWAHNGSTAHAVCKSPLDDKLTQTNDWQATITLMCTIKHRNVVQLYGFAASEITNWLESCPHAYVYR